MRSKRWSYREAHADAGQRSPQLAPDPQSQPRIVDSLFADAGHVEFEFRTGKNSPAITQEEINRVIQTVHAIK